MTHGIEAARELAAGASLADTADLTATEALIGGIWGAIAFALFKLFEVESRRRASLETF